MKKILGLLAILPLALLSCTTATLTNLTPQQQVRSTNNLYAVEVALATKQQALRWQSIKPQIVVGNEVYPMRQTPLMTNRWEGLIPVSPEQDRVVYHYKFDFEYNSFGKPKQDSAASPDYTLRIVNEKP